MFEVDKTYKYKNENYTYRCVYVTDHHALLVTDANVTSFSQDILADLNHEGWKEYKLPVVEKIVRHIRKSDYSNDGYTACMHEHTDLYEWCGSIELTFTDGKLSNVKVI